MGTPMDQVLVLTLTVGPQQATGPSGPSRPSEHRGKEPMPAGALVLGAHAPSSSFLGPWVGQAGWVRPQSREGLENFPEAAAHSRGFPSPTRIARLSHKHV